MSKVSEAPAAVMAEFTASLDLYERELLDALDAYFKRPARDACDPSAATLPAKSFDEDGSR